MIRDRFHAMGTTVEVVTDHPLGIEPTRDLFHEMERRLSRFIPSSDLNLINDDRADRVRLSSGLAEIMSVAAVMRERTDGLVDPAVGTQMAAWGYDRTFSEVTGQADEPVTDPVRPWAVEGDWLTRPPGTRFDLGGIAKGWTADLAVERGLAVLVSAGGDIRSSLPDALADVEDPFDGSHTRIGLGRGALATSSVARRRWRVADAEAHHIIDPRTGVPAVSPVVSATVLCDTAVEAEAAAKAVLMRGRQALTCAAEQEWIRAALVSWSDGSAYATHGWEYAA